MSTTTCIVIMAVCLALSAYCSATETAFSSANTTRLRTLAEKGSGNAALALKLLEQLTEKGLLTVDEAEKSRIELERKLRPTLLFA